jgi:AraC-like DNA-binding protein
MSSPAINEAHQEWSRYYHDRRLQGVEALHARFVTHRYPRHAHDYCVIALVDCGAACYWYRGAHHTASAGQVFLVNPGEPHTGDPVLADGYVYRVLYPHVDYLARVARDVEPGPQTAFFKGAVLDDPRLASLLSRFHARLAKNGSTAECESLLLRALARLLTRYGDPRPALTPVGAERPAVRTAREYIDAHFGEDISISKLASLSFLSPYYFARAFEKEIGLPPHAYLESVRIQKVRQFLDQGHSLVSAALSAGYVDQSHLTNRFKRVLGITPGQYVRNRKI